MIPPFDRKRLRERNALDELEPQADAARQSPAERLERTLDLADLIRMLGHASGAYERIDDHANLEEKARLYAAPLRILARRR